MVMCRELGKGQPARCAWMVLRGMAADFGQAGSASVAACCSFTGTRYISACNGEG